jgi:branched-chain amino acid transport system ATP-binding protein
MLVLKVEGLTCRYGKVTAVSELSLEVRKGELVSLIGANGAGKTTTLKAISGLVAPAGGRLIFDGEDISGTFSSSASPTVRKDGASSPT